MPTYEITAPDGKTLEITAPDGATQDEVLAYAKSNYAGSSQTQPAAPVDQGIGRQLGLTTRYLGEGLAALPGMVGDAANGLINTATGAINDNFGTQIPQLGYASGALSQLIDSTGLPKPQTDLEKIVAVPAKFGADLLGGGLEGRLASNTINPLVNTVAKSFAFDGDPVAPVYKPLTNETIAGQGLNLKGATASADASSTMGEALNLANDAARQETRNAWNAVGINVDTIPTSVTGLRQNFSNYVSGLTKTDQKLVPKEITEALGSFADQEPVREIQSLRARIGTLARQASATGDGDTSRVLSGLGDILQTHAETPELSGLSEEATQLYKQARAATREYKSIFNQPQVRNALKVDQYGFEKVPDSAIAANFIKSGKGAPEAFNGYLRALNKGSQTAQELGKDAARTAFTDKFLDTVANGSTKNIQKFASDYRHIVQSDIFTTAQRKTFNDITGLAVRDATKGPPRLVDILRNRIVTGTVGALTGTASGVGPLAGGMVGSAISHGVNTLIERSSASSVSGLIKQALIDPEIANALQAKASVKAVEALPPEVLNRIISALTPASVDVAREATD